MLKLIVTKGKMKGQSFSFGDEVVFVGRSYKNDLQITDSAISRTHLRIYKVGKKIYVEDLISKNGTFINGERIDPWKGRIVSERDTISIANTELRLDLRPGGKALRAKDATSRHPGDDSKKRKKAADERRSFPRKSLELIWGVTELLRQSISTDEMLEKVTEYIMESLPRIDTAVILLLDKQNGEIGKTFFSSKQAQEKDEIHYSRSIVNRVLKNSKAIRMSNTKYEPPENLSDSIIRLKIRSIMCVPLISNTVMLGAIYVYSRGAYGFRKDDLLLLNSLSGPIAVAVDKAMLAARLEESPSCSGEEAVRE